MGLSKVIAEAPSLITCWWRRPRSSKVRLSLRASSVMVETLQSSMDGSFICEEIPMGNQDFDPDLENFELGTELLGPYPSLEEALRTVSVHVSTSLMIQALSYGRSPSALSHDIILQDDGYYATVVEITQSGLVGRCRHCRE